MADHNNSLNADVAVVGSGPAGSAAAISCALAGLRVVILDRRRSSYERPGETLHPGIEVLLKQLGVLERLLPCALLRHEGIWVHWNAPPRFVFYGGDDDGPWQGFQIWGADLDAILLERARELGVEVLQSCRALAPTMLKSRVSGLETSERRIEAKFVVDAAGSRHWLTRHLGIPIHRRSPHLVARFGYVEGACHVRDTAPAIIADEKGWTWTAQVRPNLCHWTRLNLDGERIEPTFVPAELRGLPPHSRSRGADVSWRVVEKPAGAGYFIVGDAAAVLDPASSHGVLKAVLSGVLAARAIVKSLALGGVVNNTSALSYSSWIHERFDYDVAEMRGLYARLPSPPPWVRIPWHLWAV